ncbi:MAG: hypothetical protein CENE_00469 [Candidatus Celerinatantimonas neptuna]|nr:MAG: hypothetical protein CENE_00469 [Candidatus Celerinatantimonas neptuna]
MSVRGAKVDYSLCDILFDAICTVIAGGVAEQISESMFLDTMSGFSNKNYSSKVVSVDDIFARLIAATELEAFRECF